MENLELRQIITEISIFRKNDSPIFGESAIFVKLEDEAAGYFLSLSSNYEDNDNNKIKLDFEEFDEIVKAVNILRNQPDAFYE